MKRKVIKAVQLNLRKEDLYRFTSIMVGGVLEHNAKRITDKQLVEVAKALSIEIYNKSMERMTNSKNK